MVLFSSTLPLEGKYNHYTEYNTVMMIGDLALNLAFQPFSSYSKVFCYKCTLLYNTFNK